MDNDVFCFDIQVGWPAGIAGSLTNGITPVTLLDEQSDMNNPVRMSGDRMDIEHVALNVADPVAMAEWYTRHLGMRVVRSIAESPHTHFLADQSGRVVIELYRHTKAPIPDYFSMDPLVLHLAFVSRDVQGDRQQLLDAGATSAGEVMVTPTGDEMVFLRDPWGVAIQLVRRAQPLIG